MSKRVTVREFSKSQENEIALQEYLKMLFPNNNFKVIWNPFKITADDGTSNEEVRAIKDATEQWFMKSFGSGVVWGANVKVKQ